MYAQRRSSPERESGEKKFALGASLQMILQSLQASVRYLRSEKQNKTRLQRDVLERLAIFFFSSASNFMPIQRLSQQC